MKHRRQKVVMQNKTRAAVTALFLFMELGFMMKFLTITSSISEPNFVPAAQETIQTLSVVETKLPELELEPQSQPQFTIQKPVYTMRETQVVSSPDSSEVVGIIPQFSILTVKLISETDNWAWVEYDQVSGYILMSNTHEYISDKYMEGFNLEFYQQDLITDMLGVFDLDVDEYFFYGMMYTESRFTSNSESSVGAQGILQIIPQTWSFLYTDFCENYPEYSYLIVDDPCDKTSNIILGMYYIKVIQDDYGLNSISDNAHRVLTMYNRGPGGAKTYYNSNGTYVSSYSQEVLRAAEYICINHSWKEGL